MNIEIIDKELTINVFGFSGIAMNKDYSGTAFKLMDKMWKVVKSNDLKNKGLNIWVYESDEKVFAGVELESLPAHGTGLEQKSVILNKYCYYKHVGPYHLIKQIGLRMEDEIRQRGLERTSPYLEIYGHWTSDESKLETKLLMSLK